MVSLPWIGLTSIFSIEYGDFPAVYTGAMLAQQGQFRSLHDVELQTKIQAAHTAGRPDTVYFVRPHVYAAVLAPLARLSLRQAFFASAAVQGVILVFIGIWVCRRFGNDGLVLLALFPPAILAIGFGQDPMLYLGLSVLSYILYERGQLLGAGFALGCVLLKPHLMLLVPLVLILQKRWRMLGGFALAGATEAGLSLALGGIEGAKVYIAFLKKQEGYLTPNPEHMLNVHGMMVNLGLESPLIRVALMVAVIAAVVVVSIGSEWWRGLAAAQAGTMLIAPHVFMYDSTLLLLPALLIYFYASTPQARIAATLFFVPIPYLVQMADKPWPIAPSLVVSGLLGTLVFEVPMLQQVWAGIATAVRRPEKLPLAP